MAKFRPFKAIRPTRDKAHLVSSRSYITYNEEQLKGKLDTNPYSFLHIINPDFGKELSKEQKEKSKYARVRDKFELFQQKGWFLKETETAFYVYRQSSELFSCVGIIGGVCVDEYKNGKVKIHEHTITSREAMFKDYLKETKINAEPVLLSYKQESAVDSMVEKYTEMRAEYEFLTTDGILHELWVVTDKWDVETIQVSFESVQDLYIADGHHRSASSVLLADELSNSGVNSEEHNYFMAYCLPEHQLEIFGFNRLLKKLEGLTFPELLSSLESSFKIDKLEGVDLFQPTEEHEFSIYTNDTWYRLNLNGGLVDETDPVKCLDAQLLSDLILEPILGIKDLKTDKNIAFAGGPTGAIQLKQMVDSGEYEIGFGLYHVTVEQLKKVADHNMVMPPKSTWVEPKLRSGLIIYPIIED